MHSYCIYTSMFNITRRISSLDFLKFILCFGRINREWIGTGLDGWIRNLLQGTEENRDIRCSNTFGSRTSRIQVWNVTATLTCAVTVISIPCASEHIFLSWNYPEATVGQVRLSSFPLPLILLGHRKQVMIQHSTTSRYSTATSVTGLQISFHDQS
jgi:hypothetical protein